MAGKLYETQMELGRPRTAVVDLDGVIAQYDGWRGSLHFGEPVCYAREALDELSEWGWQIIVWTTRGDVESVREYLDGQAIRADGINTVTHNPPGTSGKPIADVYIDDRCWCSVGRPFSWLRVMRRLRKLYQPPLNTHIDDAAGWASPVLRFFVWLSRH